jgi:Fe-S cluster assembly scaffold protein SufB
VSVEAKATRILDRLPSKDQWHRRLSDIEDTRRWAWDARQDAAHERQLTAARYYLMGALGEDFEDDELLREVLRQAYDQA